MSKHKCTKCSQPLSRDFAPTLVPSGRGSIFSLKCPICNRIYDKSGVDRTKEFKEKYHKEEQEPKTLYNSNKGWR